MVKATANGVPLKVATEQRNVNAVCTQVQRTLAKTGAGDRMQFAVLMMRQSERRERRSSCAHVVQMHDAGVSAPMRSSRSEATADIRAGSCDASSNSTSAPTGEKK